MVTAAAACCCCCYYCYYCLLLLACLTLLQVTGSLLATTMSRPPDGSLLHNSNSAAAAVHTPTSTCQRHTRQQLPRYTHGCCKASEPQPCPVHLLLMLLATPLLHKITVCLHTTQAACSYDCAFCCRTASCLPPGAVAQAAATPPHNTHTSQAAPGHHPTYPTPPGGPGPVLTGSYGCAHAAGGLLVCERVRKRAGGGEGVGSWVGDVCWWSWPKEGLLEAGREAAAGWCICW